MPRDRTKKGSSNTKSIKKPRTNQKPTEQVEIEAHIQACNTAAADADSDEMELKYDSESDIAETDDLAALVETQSQVDATTELMDKFPERAQHLHVYPTAQKVPAKIAPQSSPTDSVATTDSIVTFLTPTPPLAPTVGVNSGLGVGKGGAGRYKQALMNKDKILAKFGKVPASFNSSSSSSSKSPRVIQAPSASKAPRSNIVPINSISPELATVVETTPAVIINQKRKAKTTAASTATKQLNQNKQSIKVGGRSKQSNPKRIKAIELENKRYPDDELDLSWDPSDSESENEQVPKVKSIIPSLPFNRIIREIAQDIRSDLRFQPIALTLLREEAESYVVSLFNNSKLVATAANRITLQVQDMRVAEKIMNRPYEITKSEIVTYK